MQIEIPVILTVIVSVLLIILGLLPRRRYQLKININKTLETEIEKIIKGDEEIVIKINKKRYYIKKWRDI
ncbi:hypothetical protein H3N56_11300 [Cetobacterium sp. 2A]|uniref:hypothetical protein n=1 Tax=Cetobacterium sp. 2A TaxID=2754723 RepID=UPI00163C870D|nr:hypothetical protein [Cetobacterium sp. 2A]MBC2857018.1 hypothetical protein [Cetobacterium sp. 2A]